MTKGDLSSCFHMWLAGNGNRTRMASLEGWNFTIKLCPRADEYCLVRQR
jgi:hypothetical protein